MEGSPRAVKVLAERSYTASFYERLTGALIRQNNTKISFLSRSPEWKDSKTRSFVGLDGCDLVCRELRLAEKPEGKLGTKHQARQIQETTFLPAAKPSGPRTVRVVGVGGGRDRDPTPKKIYIADIEMVLKFNFVFFCSRPSLHVPSLFISHP